MTTRWLCDEMLGGLATLLRAAGHDVLLARPGSPDAELSALAAREGRLLLTRDRALAAAAGPRAALLLGAAKPDEQARELGRSVPVDWRLAPFTRCLVDGSVLRPAAASEIADAPPASRTRPGPFRFCPTCARLYWPGSHVRRMQARLDRLATRDEEARPARGAPP